MSVTDKEQIADFVSEKLDEYLELTKSRFRNSPDMDSAKRNLAEAFSYYLNGEASEPDRLKVSRAVIALTNHMSLMERMEVPDELQKLQDGIFYGAAPLWKREWESSKVKELVQWEIGKIAVIASSPNNKTHTLSFEIGSIPEFDQKIRLDADFYTLPNGSIGFQMYNVGKGVVYDEPNLVFTPPDYIIEQIKESGEKLMQEFMRSDKQHRRKSSDDREM